jgi:hypothetical protein
MKPEVATAIKKISQLCSNPYLYGEAETQVAVQALWEDIRCDLPKSVDEALNLFRDIDLNRGRISMMRFCPDLFLRLLKTFPDAFNDIVGPAYLASPEVLRAAIDSRISIPSYGIIDDFDQLLFPACFWANFPIPFGVS